MSNFDDVIEKCKKQMTDQNIAIDEALLTAIAKSLGPSIYNADALSVAAADEGEMNTVRGFMTKKLGCEPGDEMEAALGRAVETIGKSNRNKLRPVLYYLLVKDLGKESVYA